ncbi:hypothetical protein P170DRAFT_512097 [Aspergillus steynii IBT 23096]|uniref:CWH43-like N-terminal domain-containing protein n=1 Tax=Aspergillus steynii IBT 23096 TaxID=1392250 RepID=A0A2I2FXN4_9EURO|nr:uncharacterized protein P170DRAFT_512097 [Aspergillus steynii IBT 23096]PLB45395.1 hypothetical protein P170DRAFT_512097 [Aspergillus steynii IBT 23096]
MTPPFLDRCHDSVWCSLHGIILNIPPTRLPLFPALAGSVWFLTLASLLLTWIARGRPQYPGQSNPHVAFISDIASFELKPLFLVGASITAVGFAFSVAIVHVVRYEPGFALVRCPAEASSIATGRGDVSPAPVADDRDDANPDSHVHPHVNEHDDVDDEDHETTKTLKFVSLLAIFAASVASTALILLGVMDTFRYKRLHHVFLRICFSGLAVQSACTAIVYSNEVLGFISYVYHLGIWQHDWGKRSQRVRVFASLSTALILVEVFLAVAFISLTVSEENPISTYRTAGILEWIIAFLGTVYLWLFCGFLDRTSFDTCVPSALYHPPTRRKPSGQAFGPSASALPDPDPERAPLLAHAGGGKYT